MTDQDIWKLNRGGHDPHKVYAAYHAAMQHKGSPTVILAKTIKGYGMGKSGESINTTHQQKKLDEQDLLYYRDRFEVPAPSIFAPQEFKKFIKSTTSGSFAQFFKFVTPGVKIAAIIKFSVPVTEILGKEKSIGLSFFASR